MSGAAAKTDHYLAEFPLREPHLPGRNLPWLRAIRTAALERFAESGFPTPRNEEWRYTPVTPIQSRAFPLAEPDDIGAQEIERFEFEGIEHHRLVFVNGWFAPQLSHVRNLPEGAVLTHLAGALEAQPALVQAHLARYADANGDAFTALNSAFAADGAFVHLASGTRLEEPILLLFVSSTPDGAAAAHPRNLLIAEEGAQATLIERYVSVADASYFTNAVTEVVVAPGARLTHYKLQEESGKAFHIGGLHVYQDRDSTFTSHYVSLGGSLVRNDIRSLLDAEGAECVLNGLYVASGRQHVDSHTRIDHARPHGTSRELYKGILDGAAHGVFAGKVIVHPDAQKTDAQQANKNLLLSRGAEIDTKPQLEIYADDVKCSHGATVGQLDREVLFYLRSRGIDEEAARSLLTFAFASDVLRAMTLHPLRQRVEESLVAKLPKGQRVKEFL
jgi:Fe-S cluster assembly protein SufD